MRCPGSVREESKYPETPSGPSAIDGTHTHTLLEKCIDARLTTADSFVGKSIEDHEGIFVVDLSRVQRVNIALDYIFSRIKWLEDQGFKDIRLLSEEKVDPQFYTEYDNQKGSADVQIHCIDGKYLEVIDLKDGMGEVDVKENEQLDLYALGSLAKYQVTSAATSPFDTIRTTIIQPKFKVFKNIDPIAFSERSITDVLALADVYKKGARATQDPNAPLIPGEKQCKFCRHKACAARNQAVMSAVGITFPAVSTTQEKTVITDLEEVNVAQHVANTDPVNMTDEQLRELLDAAPLIRQAIERAEEEVQRRLEMGVPVPGFKLVNGRGANVWALPDDEIAEKLRGMGVPKDVVYVTKVVSPAQAKKLQWEKRDGSKKSLSDRQIKTLEKEYISHIAGKLTVAPESDPRPAVVRDASPMFDTVQQNPSQPEPVAAALPDWMQTPDWLK